MELTLPSSVELRVFPTEGRGLVAREQFAPGDMLLCTKPYVHVLGAEGVKGFCGMCVKRLSADSAIACPKCSFIKYCSTQCKEGDQVIHRTECLGIEKYGIGSLDNVRLLLRVLERRNLNDNHNSEKDAGKSQDPMDVLSHTGGELSLVDELYTRTIIKLVQSILKDSEVTIATDTDEKTVSETLSKLAQNSFTLYHGNQRIIGSAVYLLPAMINHSCSPNCWWVNDGVDLMVHANQRISPGEQLRITYASILDTRQERREELKEKYSFDCKCSRCSEDEGVDELLNSVTCPTCDKVATGNGSTPQTEFPIQYCVCSRRPYCYGGKTRKQIMKCFYRKWRKLSEKGFSQDSYHKLLDLVSEVHKCFPTFSRISIEMNETLQMWAESFKDWNTYIVITTQLQDAYRLYGGEYSPVLGTSHLKLGVVYLEQSKQTEVCQQFEKAYEQLLVVYGRKHALTVDLVRAIEKSDYHEIIKNI